MESIYKKNMAFEISEYIENSEKLLPIDEILNAVSFDILKNFKLSDLMNLRFVRNFKPFVDAFQHHRYRKIIGSCMNFKEQCKVIIPFLHTGVSLEKKFSYLESKSIKMVKMYKEQEFFTLLKLSDEKEFAECFPKVENHKERFAASSQTADALQWFDSLKYIESLLAKFDNLAPETQKKHLGKIVRIIANVEPIRLQTMSTEVLCTGAKEAMKENNLEMGAYLISYITEPEEQELATVIAEHILIPEDKAVSQEEQQQRRKEFEQYLHKFNQESAERMSPPK